MKKRYSIIGMLFVVLILGIGYATVTTRYFNIRGTASINGFNDSFIVRFNGTTSVSSEKVRASVDGGVGQNATLIIDGLEKRGDVESATFTIENASKGVDAVLRVTGYGAEGVDSSFFKVDTVLDSEILTADPNGNPNDSNRTTVTVYVTALRRPIDDITSSIYVKLEATPIEED